LPAAEFVKRQNLWSLILIAVLLEQKTQMNIAQYLLLFDLYPRAALDICILSGSLLSLVDAKATGHVRWQVRM